MSMHTIEIYGHADAQICSGCEGDHCGSCAPGEKKRTIELVDDFRTILKNSELGTDYSVEFFESTPETISRNPDVEKLLSMANLEPVICLDTKISYLGGFSPEGLLTELRKKQKGY